MKPKRALQYQDKLRQMYPEEGHLNMAQNITFQVTDSCNLKCTYCYQINKGCHSMSFETAKKFIDMILSGNKGMKQYVDSHNSQGVIIEFIGGEPFLEIDLIDKITDYFIKQMIILDHPWKKRFRISICSNGILYHDPRVQKYIKKHLNHLSFSISIDGNKELHDACRVFSDGSGSYDIAMSGVNHFVNELHGAMGSKMTLCPENIQHTFSAVKSLIEHGYDEINLNCVYEEGWNVEHARIFYEQLKLLADYIIDNDLFDKLYLSIFEENFFRPKSPDDLTNWCGGDGRMISVDYKGDIYPCIRYMESSLGTDQEPLKIGNVDYGIMQQQCEKSCVECLRGIDRRSQSTDECFNCPIAEGCSWCTAYNYQLFGTPDKRATFICIMHKARALANAYYWNKGFNTTKQNKRMKLWIPKEWALEIVSQNEYDFLIELTK